PDRRRVVGIGRAMPYDHVADAARCLAAHGHQAAPIVEVAILDDDVLRGPVDAQSVLVLPGLDGDGVVVVVDIHVAHAHLARRVDVDAIRARNVVVAPNRDAIHDHVLGVQNVQAPDGLLLQMHAGNPHALAILEADHARPSIPGARRWGAAPRRRSASTSKPATREPHVARPIHGAVAAKIHAGHAGEVQQRRGPHPLDAFPTRLHLRIVALLHGPLQRAVLLDVQVHSLFEEQCAGEEGPFGHYHGASALFRHLVNQRLEGRCVGCLALAHGAKAGNGETLGPASRRYGSDGEQRHHQNPPTNGLHKVVAYKLQRNQLAGGSACPTTWDRRFRLSLTAAPGTADKTDTALPPDSPRASVSRLPGRCETPLQHYSRGWSLSSSAPPCPGRNCAASSRPREHTRPASAGRCWRRWRTPRCCRAPGSTRTETCRWGVW